MNSSHSNSMNSFYSHKWQGHKGYWLDRFQPSAQVYALCLGKARNDAIVGAVPKRVNKVLDIGCGVGDLMRLFSPTSELVAGLDVAEVNVHQARKNLLNDNIHNVIVLQGFAETLPFAEDTFDLIVMADVIEHIPEIDVVFREVERILQPNGLFICVTPHARLQKLLVAIDSVGSLLFLPIRLLRRNYKKKSSPAVFERFLSPAALRQGLEQSKLKPLEYKRICFYPGPEGTGTFGLFMKTLYRLLGAVRFIYLADWIVSLFEKIERVEVFNQKQMWVAQK